MINSKTIATLGGGCFWCLEAVFQELRGVEEVVSGYAGGRVKNPTYREVCSGLTGHAEVVQLTFSPDQLSFRDLLGVFFAIHDPTTLNRQGADVGTQYRSIILYQDEEQERVARSVITDLTTRSAFQNPIVTEVVPFQVFFPAEDYHQNYFRDNRSQPYCQFVVGPKLDKFRSLFADRTQSGH
jgi:peptide-methionine (S)-S-oxide reductase